MKTITKTKLLKFVKESDGDFDFLVFLIKEYFKSVK